MKPQVTAALSKLFEDHRIVFWYDAKQELRADFESVELPDVEKVEIQNNEFQLKHRMLRDEPGQKFLVFKDGPEPSHIENWLLDVQLAHTPFHADQTALWMTELGLNLQLIDVVRQHKEFFKDAKRREELQRLDVANDTKSQLRMKLLAVCTKSEARLDAVLESLLAESAEERDRKFRLIQRCQLDEFLWEAARRVYGYRSETTSLADFVLTLFDSCYAMSTNGEEAVHLNNEALVFLRRWKDSIRNKAAFEIHSASCADHLNIQDKLASRDYRELSDTDYFELVDKKMLSELARHVRDRTISPGECTRLIRQRRSGHWFSEYQHEYEAVDFASQLMGQIDSLQLEMETLHEGLKRYTQLWYEVDQLYRRFSYHYAESQNKTLLNPLFESVEKWYSNKYLLQLNDRWQALVDEQAAWLVPDVHRQRDFFKDHVQSFVRQNVKVFVLISDGLRYEIGQQLAERIRREDKYSAETEFMLTGLPSYTQLGMASLLPNSSMKINADRNASVDVDGQSSMGTANRQKILQNALGADHAASAVLSRDLLAMNRDECRNLVKNNDVVYVYQNIIDATGDKAQSEHRVFQAAEEAMDELVTMVKKLVSGNASNILITSDHGFIYQAGVEESDFAGPEANQVVAAKRDRRFLLGNNLESADGLAYFATDQLGLEGDIRAAIPKSINRLRLRGSGFRYVHGGCTLQETVVPVLAVSKSRTSDVQQVEVDVIRGNVNTISTGQLSVVLYQRDPVDDKLQPRTLRVSLVSESKQPISDYHEVCFDMRSENPREREHKLRLVLSRDADQFNEQQVFLQLEELIPSTSYYGVYASHNYTLRRSFVSDFDFD